MAKEYYDGDITLKTDWGGDESTGNLPVTGKSVQKVIKDSINSKVGYVGRVERTGQGFYVLSRDEETFNTYLTTISDENPFGDLEMDGINGRFDAPFNYKMNITLISPESGYKSTLLGSVGNVIKFKAETLDNNNTPQSESMTITYKIKTEGGVESTYTAIYDGNIASQGIEYSLDGKLGTGMNTVTITAVGMNTGISAMRRITYRLIDMYFTDKFDISKRYQFTSEGTLAMTVGYDLKGVGKTKILWYFDGNHYATDELTNMNPNLANTSRSFYFTESANPWLTPGIHNIQMSMICKDNDSGEEFQTPIYYREFIIEKTPTVLNTPYIVRKASFDNIKGFLPFGTQPTIYNCRQFENVEIEYAAYYNGKSTCNVRSYIKYGENDIIGVSVEDLPLIADDFSDDQKLLVSLNNDGLAEIVLRAYYNDEEYFETVSKLEILPSDMNITTVTDNVVLDLNAFGRSNNASGKDVWEYSYVDSYGKEQKITTTFSKNEYAVISTHDSIGNVVAPTDANESNTLAVDELPQSVNDEYKYLLYNNEYYAWNREFDWSDTSGWSDNKLKLANGNAITINYKPFSEDKLPTIKAQGLTFEIEFETTNVYNDDAVICRICGNENFAPGIVISASGAELVISRETVTDGENAGYTKKVSTKYKAEESNRISFVITPDRDDEGYRNRILSIYVNGKLSGAYAYDHGTNFFNDSNISFRGNEDACINISSIKIYGRQLSSNEILGNYIYYRTNTDEKAEVYKRNDIMLESNDESFDSDKLKSQLPVMMIYQIDTNQSLDDIHQEKKNKKLTRFFDVVYIDIQNPSRNFLIKNAYITPQGTSSMNYPVKNLRLYSGKKDKAGEYYSRMFVGSNIFIDGSPNNVSWENINLDTEVKKKRQYSFKEGSIPVNCWCFKADFAESSSAHNTATSRYWNQVLKNAGFSTKAQVKAAKYYEQYPYDIRTAIDGFPVVVFYQPLDGSAPRFEGKYNFNNDKSTESVFGFTGGIEIDDQEVKYFYIGKEKPVVHGEENDEGEWEWACDFESGGYTEYPTTKSPLYASKINADGSEDWYMLRGKELLDNPKMECWEILNSVNEIALFKTMKGFGTGDDDEKIGIVKENGDFDEAFESRYPDCGDYYHYNSLKRFGEWLVSCRYLNVDDETGMCVPFAPASLPTENYHVDETTKKLSICSLTKQTGKFEFNFPGYNFYQEVDYNSIASSIKSEGYQQISIDDKTLETIEYLEVDAMPTTKVEGYEYIKFGEVYYTWMPSNVLTVDTLPTTHESSYAYVLVGSKYYVWANTYNFEDFHNTQWVDDTAFNRALKFAVEKYDHIEMNKMAAYYIYLMRFGGVDQTVKNSMLTTEGSATDDANSTLPSLWYFINYDNDTILGVKNDGRLVFDPYITRETKDGTGYVYAGRESTLWNNLEADAQFMAKVTEVDNKLADGGADPLFSLSYSNALREYDTNQSDKWCERIYNKDAERKYIDTYVKGWVQKNDSDKTETHVYEDYLYDVQGSRSAHRKWWLGRRFNVFDSRFCNSNFRNQLIKFRSTNLPAGSSFSIVSGEPIFYAWGHDNAVTAMTPTAIQPGDRYTFTTNSAFNIGSYLELMGAANISTLDLRDCVGALTEIDITGCYSPLVGTKMKEILVGDHKRTDLVNISNTSLKFSGLANASKVETIDMTNIQNAVSLDGLSSLLNIREVYAKGTSIANFTFADGAMIETLELPGSVETLSLTRSSSIDYSGIKFDGKGYGKLTNLTIDNCSKLMDNSDFVINWIGSRTIAERNKMSLNLQGINWKFNINNYSNLFLLADVGVSGMAQRNIRGNIEITARLDISDVVKLKNIFGEECFKEGSKVYIKAPTALYVDVPSTMWEGDSNIKCEITTVGTTLSGNLMVSAIVNEIVDGETEQKVIGATNGIITMDESNLAKGYTLVNILESNNVYEYFVLAVTYQDASGFEMMEVASTMIKKRRYPNAIKVSTLKDSYNNKTKNELSVVYSPTEINDVNLDGRGKFSVNWRMIDGSSGYNNSLVLHDADKEIAYIQASNGFDGTVVVEATVTRIYDNVVLARNTKEIEFTNPDTIITKFSNEPVYKVLVKHGIIKEDESGFGKLTKTEAGMVTMNELIENGKSIFAGNTEIESFLEFQFFSNSEFMGQMPQNGVEATVTPNGMFKGCTKLKEISFSVNFKYTGEESMFEGCTNLEHIYGPYASNDENGNPIYSNLSFVHIGTNFAKGCKKLKTCLLSSTAKFIGANAFNNCISLEYFQLPNSPEAVIECDNKKTAFQDCEKITFYGAEYDSVSSARYQVKDGACLELKDDGTLVLVHLGKNTPLSALSMDKTIYAASYSMEYCTESDVVVPNNILFNGEGIFNCSKGESITLTTPISSSITCKSLFLKTDYKEYNFAENEVTIPESCFKNSALSTFVIPEGIEVIGNEAFYQCTSLTSITLPSTLLSIRDRAFNISTKLKDVTCKGSKVPTIGDSVFFGIMLDNWYVNPEHYETYKAELTPLLRPFVKSTHLYNEGYVRIIKDGEYLICDETNVVTVGGVDVTQRDDYYMRYINDTINTDFNVKLNGNVIGEISGMYTTLYVGDNSSLFSGNGYNFTKGVFDNEIRTMLESNGWFYDSRFEGVRSYPTGNRGQTEITLTLDSFDSLTPFVYGYYAKTPQGGVPYGYVKDNSNVEILHITESKYNVTENLLSGNGIFKIGFAYSTTPEGINGIIVNSLGNSIYSDPELPNVMTYTRNMASPVKTITVNLSAQEEIPSNVYVTVTDNMSHTFRKFWNGDALTFNVPTGVDFEVLSADFIIDGKVYTVEKTVKSDENTFELVYSKKTGIEINNDTLCYYTDDNDWYIKLTPETQAWGTMGMNIEDINVEEILSSSTYGLENCSIIEKIDKNSICSKVLVSNAFDKGIIGYVPSFIELELLSQHLFEINEYLYSKKLMPIDLTNCWVSETYDENNAWTSDGNYVTKDTVLKYYIFGKRITL